MTKTDRIPKPWGAFLRDLDDIATAAVDFHCIGGFVVNMKYGFSSRQTFDIDVLAITPKSQRQEFLQNAAKGSVLHRKHGVYLDLVTVIQAYPEDYDQRLTEMYSGQLKKIRLFAVEPHDLALMKLDAGSAGSMPRIRVKCCHYGFALKSRRGNDHWASPYLTVTKSLD